MTDPTAVELARRFHDTYERLAPDFGYETRRESARPWEDVPPRNQQLMVATAQVILDGILAPMVENVRRIEVAKAAIDESLRKAQESGAVIERIRQNAERVLLIPEPVVLSGTTRRGAWWRR